MFEKHHKKNRLKVNFTFFQVFETVSNSAFEASCTLSYLKVKPTLCSRLVDL